MKKILLTLALVALALSTAGAGERWLHVRVDGVRDGDHVRINVPLRFAEGLLGAVDTADLDEGRPGLGVAADLEGLDVRAILAAVRDAPDSEFVTVRTEDESIRVAKERGFVVAHIDADGGDRVRVRVPLAVIEAAVRGPRDELDLSAALRALADYGDVDLVHIDSDDESVRIWVDSNDTGD